MDGSLFRVIRQRWKAVELTQEAASMRTNKQEKSSITVDRHCVPFAGHSAFFPIVDDILNPKMQLKCISSVSSSK